jgi:nitroimidazol reductase NimA-like FMN-containing flavoprotein (pyridoxamine 5'-phosphate oxidase superfamily)
VPTLGDLRAAPPRPMTPEQAVAIMTIQERESFLAEARVGVLGVAAGSGRGPVLVPVWYHYRPGRELTVLTERGSRKAALIRAAGQISLCVQTEQPPYRYVSVEGPVTKIEESVTLEDRRALARRYLGPAGGGRYVESTATVTPDIIAIQMLPRHWLAVDQGRR